MTGKIENKQQLKNEIDRLYSGIENYCQNCNYKDCVGVISVLPEEIDELVDMGIEIIEANNKVHFLNNYEYDENGEPDLDVISPKCKLRECDGSCSIQDKKPIVCMLYPIIPASVDQTRKLYWALHLDCLYVQEMISKGKKDKLKKDFLKLVNNIDVNFYDKIINAFRNLETICDYPDGYNNIEVLKEV